MIRGRGFLIALTWALSALAANSAFGQTLRMRTEAPKTAESDRGWGAQVRYSVVSDFADTRSPRAYTHSLFLGFGYQFNENWTLGAEVGGRAELIDGQISKGPEQSYAETVSPSTAMELDYENKFFKRHKYSFNLIGEPLWDEPSRLEGYKGLVGVGGDVVFNFFDGVYSMSHSLNATELLNTFEYGTNGSPNPDYFYTYRFGNSIRFAGTYKFSAVFGMKMTRYLDGFWGYAYQTSLAVSKTWKKLTIAASYDNGGFTDDGELNLWYIDQYRRFGRLSVNYTF